MKKPGSARDPLWFKDAVIYELHARAFFDKNGDGVGDLPGLTQKLDYLQDLGVTCLWLLPFFPSPLRDDGYDISDYNSVHPMYGTVEDFRTFLGAAHDRGLQVMIELVMNHTSDQHPWFEAARRAPAGSPEREFYVWSDSVERYKDARIIFTDTEKSNWTWDPVAQAYYWHRFFSHQPDLNFDNPKVVEEILKTMRFWLDMGVDALRLDAIPYLVERDGTSCENLPETHDLIKMLRREIDERYESRMILAEANQWPTDVRPYFGDGDECQMAFHFPLMPRIYMALRQEDRLAITDIMAQTPAIPETCQWGLFLRNHDELTLEMVTNDERDYMYLAYSADTRMRVNLGIRRRLAPLVDNNRRRIELLNSLLFSFPGTPILYYGDEIGMGDNIYLGDRNSVRTPMQWNADRNAGFSHATPAKLYSPVIMDPVWGYEAINVEAQQSDPSSLLNWMRNMIALRKLFRVFGRGSLEFLNPANRKILAYLRRYEDEQVLCVANLSRFAQPVDLDLAELEGMTPVEMLGYVPFPQIERQPYRLSLGPYGFLWLELHGKPEPVATVSHKQLPPILADNWEAALDGHARSQLEGVLLPRYLPEQGWFREKARRIQSARAVDWCILPGASAVLMLVEVEYEAGEPEKYLLPLALAYGPEAERIQHDHPGSILTAVSSRLGAGVMYDATDEDALCESLISLIETTGEQASAQGKIRGIPGMAIASIRGAADTQSLPRDTAGQAHRAANGDVRFSVTMFHRQRACLNPAIEMARYLTETAHFDGVAPFAGSIEYHPDTGEPSTWAMLQGEVASEGDGWGLTLEELERYYETCARVPLPEELVGGGRLNGPDLIELSAQPPSKLAQDYMGIVLDSIVKLAKRTAELHLALAAHSDEPAFSPEPLTSDEAQRLFANLHQRSAKVFDLLRDRVAQLPDETLDLAGLVLGRRKQTLDKLRWTGGGESQGQRIRIHGDYRLGRILRVRTEWVIVGFDGVASAQTVEEWRAKQSPLQDVASMLGSFASAAYVSLVNYTARRPEDFEGLEPWARLWEQASCAEFLRVYLEAVSGRGLLPSSAGDARRLLAAYWVDKALQSLSYELDNRPSWARIPLMMILSLPMEAGGPERNSKLFRSGN